MKSNIKYFGIIFCISILIGFLLGKVMRKNDIKDNTNVNIGINNVINKNEFEVNNIQNKKIIETSFEEEKIIVDTKLILRKYYLDCNHIISKEVELPQELVNLSKDEIREKYPEWEIEKFSTKELILYKKVYGLCGEHFIIESGEDFIEVYSLDEEYDKDLYEVTNISIEYLTDEDIEKLEEGIYVYGLEELNSTLESFE